MTQHHVRRPVRAWNQVTDGAAFLERVRQGQAASWTSRRIAEELNATGHRTPRGNPPTAASVRQLRKRVDSQAANAWHRRKKKRKRAAPAGPPR